MNGDLQRAEQGLFCEWVYVIARGAGSHEIDRMDHPLDDQKPLEIQSMSLRRSEATVAISMAKG